MSRDPGGRVIYVEGRASGGGWYPYRRFVDTASGRWLSAPEPDPQDPFPSFGALFSADGRFGALPASDDRGAAIVLVELDANPPRSTRISLESSPPPGWTTSFALSPRADSVFVVHETGASIFSLPSGRRVATTTITPGWRPAATRFVGEGAGRAWLVPWHADLRTARPRAEMCVVDLAADGRSQTTVFPIAAAIELPYRSWRAVLPDDEGGRLATVDAGVHLRDGATGALLATLSASGDNVTTSFLADGRVVVGESRFRADEPGRPATTLGLFDRDGAKLGEMVLDLRPPGLTVGPEVSPGKILVASFRSPLVDEDTLLVDVAAGRVVERLRGLRPATGFSIGPSASAAGGGPASVQFFRDPAGRVLRIDFATGARTTVAGPGTPPGRRVRVDW
jgi:hypothetical protein